MEDKERDKYTRMWQVDRYRKSSPGERLVDDAVVRLGMKPGSSVIDFGCGTGRAAARFQAIGMDVKGIDIADNCLDDDVDIPLTVQCLWHPSALQADNGFCTDVMEHIPTEHVDGVLEHIASSVSSVYFQIATRPDVMGKLIGDTLHLTVESADWWRERLLEHFQSVEMDVSKGSVIAVCR